MKIVNDVLSLAGEYAVASELCRRNIYAQLVLGNRKRTDILAVAEKGMLRVEVKSKQDQEWPWIKGIFGKDILLIFVDFENKKENERPDFYILTVYDWKKLVEKEFENFISNGEIVIDKNNVPIWQDEKKRQGVKIRAEMLGEHKERWNKIIEIIGEVYNKD